MTIPKFFLTVARYAAVPALALASATLSPAMAATEFTIGGNTTESCLPWACSYNLGASDRYQQLYNRMAFADSVTLTSLFFAYNSVLPPGLSYNPGTFSLSLSTSSRTAATLSATDFDSNLGANNQLVFSGTLAPQSNGDGLLFAITPFTYDPTQGDLLLDVQISGSNGPATITTYFKADDSGTSFVNVSNFAPMTQAGTLGLQTTFNLPVPEPSTWAMLILGFGLVGGVARTDRRRVAA